MARRGKKDRRDPPRLATVPGPHRGDDITQLVDLCERLWRRELGQLRPRLLVVRRGGVEELVASAYVEGLGVDGIAQAGAVLARSVEPEEIVGWLLPCQVSGRIAVLEKTRKGVAHGAGAGLFAASLDGRLVAKIWYVQDLSHGRGLQWLCMDMPPDSYARHADFRDDGFYIDPAVETLLAERGFPGASPATAARAPMAAILSSSDGGPERHGPAPRTDASASAAQLAPPHADGGAAASPPDEPLDSMPWEPARRALCLLWELTPGALGRLPVATTPANTPAGLKTRPLDDLLAHGWRDEAQAVHVTQRLRTEPDLLAAWRSFGRARLPIRVQMLACARAATEAVTHKAADVQREAVRELLDLASSEIEPAGGVREWLASRWPSNPRPADTIVTVDIAIAATVCYWRLRELASGRSSADVARDPAFAEVMAEAARLRDLLLDASGVAPGPVGDRLVAIAGDVLDGAPEAGEHRQERWLKRIAQHHQQQPARRDILDHAAWHAANLHSLVVILDVNVSTGRACDAQDRSLCAPEAVPTAGLLRRAREVLARACTLKAALATEAGAVDQALELLAHARMLTPADAIALGCHAEARFRADRWDAELLQDLMRESAGGRLGPAAEGLRVCERIGRRRAASTFRKWVVERAAPTEHAWIARARALFARPEELAELAAVERLLASAPDPAVLSLDARDRAVFALYGADPAAAIADYLRALRALRDGLEWALLVAELGPDPPARAAAPSLPDCPRDPGPGAVVDGIEALGARVARHRDAALRRDLEAHIGRATELAATGDGPHGAHWLEAVGAPGGLAAVLEHGGDVRAALDRAEQALGGALAAAWLTTFHARLAALWPIAAQLADPDPLRRRVHQLAERAASADAQARAVTDGLLTALLEEVAGRSEGAPDEDAAATDDTAPAPDDFAPMQIAHDAVERSRRELAAPDWALQEGLRQVAYFNLARGRRDLKMLRGTRDDRGALWELRHRDARHPVRVVYRWAARGPIVCAIFAKHDDAQQRRVLERVREW